MSTALQHDRHVAHIADVSNAIDYATEAVADSLERNIDEIVRLLDFHRFAPHRARACKEGAQKAIAHIIREYGGDIPQEIERLHLEEK